MRGGWHLIGLANWLIQFGVTHHAVGDIASARRAEPFTIVDGGERYVQPVGCWEPAPEGGWHLSISWLDGMPCKARSKFRGHAFAALPDLECTAVRCVLPRPGTTFRATLAIDVIREPQNRTESVQASVSVLRHQPPYLFLGIEAVDQERGIAATGVIRVKLYKLVAHKVDPESWRPDDGEEPPEPDD